VPSDFSTGTSAEIEEERRLLYVALMRAKDDLDLIVPQQFLSTVRTPKAIVTSVPRGPASFRMA
jgi:superfamily I DNA/RNA helicase